MSESSSTNFKSLSSRIEISAREINQGVVLERSCPENLNIAQIEMEKIEKNDKQWCIHNSAATKNDTYFESVKFLYRDNFTLIPPSPRPFPSDHKCTFSAISRKVVGKNVPRQSRKVISDMLNTLFLTL